MNNCVKFFKDYGFCLLENVIPQNKIESIRQEIINASDTKFTKYKEYSKIIKK